MDLDSDTLYLGAGRSFTSYSASRERDKERDRLYDKLALDKYTSFALTTNSGLTATTNTATTTSYRPSSLFTTDRLVSNSNPLLNKTSLHLSTNFKEPSLQQRASFLGPNINSSTANLYSTSTAALDNLILSSSRTNNATSNITATTTTTTTNTTSGGGGLLSSSKLDLLQPTSRVQSSLGAVNNNLLQQLFDDMRQIEDTVDSIEIPARGRCRVYMAKYGYDPFKQSPNDNPDAELAFNAGDYIMVFDDIDEDGYFIGELMDGRRGYVPSNWLDRLTGEDLLEFQASTLYKQAKVGSGGGDEEAESNSYPPEFYDAILSDTKSHSNFQHLLAPEHYHRMNDYVDLDDVNEVDDECLSDYERAEAEQMRRAVPPPQRLVLERQLNKSILIGWLHPLAAKGTIVSYQVYVDGVLKSTVPSGDRTKALLEGVDSSIPHRISVRAIDLQGRHSNDAGCTIVIGQKIPFAPSCVKASHITSDSALISWLPANSNFHHVVAVNSVEVQTVRPGVYKHLINGLSANTLYRVWVRAKPGKILSIDEKNPKKLEFLTTYVDFTTMPKSLPDPPVNVQVEAGPQRRTLLVTWLPLTLNDFGSSNGCAVTGYAVFAGHKKLADIDSPTGDHALLDLTDLESLHKKSVTVRTKSGENLSQDSMPCHIPDEYLKAAAANTLSGNASLSGQSREHHHHHHHHQQQPQHHQASSAIRHGSANALHQHHRLSDAQPLGLQSPMRASRYLDNSNSNSNLNSNSNRMSGGFRSQHGANHSSLLGGGGNHTNSRYSTIRGRQLARSLQNLESDLDSRHSSIVGLDGGGARNSGDLLGEHLISGAVSGGGGHHNAESYSEEEFESSMRFRGGSSRARPSGRGLQQTKFRPRQSHSVDSYTLATSNRYPTQQQNKHLQRGQTEIRYFVALFDYDPLTMSPNPNAASEELAFKEGSVIKVLGDKGPDGFYRGELDNHIGYVPCNVVTEITDPQLLFNLQQQESVKLGAALQLRPVNQQQQLAAGQQQQQQLADGVKRMTALYDYDPQENSPNADTESEIPFKVGDVIYVYGKMDTDGFYMGEVERTKQRGLVPSNFLREDPLTVGAMKQQQQPTQLMSNMQMNANQFGNQAVPQQQPPGTQPQQLLNANPMDLQQQQQQQFAQINKLGQQQQQQQNPGNLRATGLNNLRGQVPTSNLNQGNLLQQNINRPTTLSLNNQQPNNQLGATGDWTSNNQQRQQQLATNQIGGIIGGQMNQFAVGNMMQPQQMLPQQQQLLGQQQQPIAGNQMNPMALGNSQQQPSCGVLGNLLSSGKQIIGAATTPRMPNQANQFPSTAPGTNPGLLGGPMGTTGPSNILGNMGGMSTMGSIGNQQQHPAGNLMDGGGGLYQQALRVGGTNLLPHQQQQQQPQAFNLNDPAQQAVHNSFSLGQNQQQQQQHQQQPYQMINRPGQMGNPMGGEEQGGNILNTVKNMFKL